MIQMGRYEELGSGVLNVSRYVPLYAGGAEARFEEGNTFRVTVPLTVSPEVTTQVTAQVTTQVERLLNVLSGEMTRSDAQAAVGLNNREHFRHNYLQPALQLGLIEMTIPKNPNSRLQKYRLTEKGKATVEMIRRSIE